MRWLAACGIIVIVLDVLITMGLAAIDPAYSHSRQYISELGEAGRPYALAFNAWCVIWGLLFAGFAVSLGRGLRSRAVLIGCLTIAASSVVSAFFPCDPGGTVQTAIAEVHVVSGYVGITGMILTPILAWSAMRGNAQWHGYGAFSLACSAILVAATCWLATCHFLSRDEEECAAGVAQRLMLASLYVWMVAVAIRLWRLESSD